LQHAIFDDRSLRSSISIGTLNFGFLFDSLAGLDIFSLVHATMRQRGSHRRTQLRHWDRAE
jgi:hypothetical protein